MRKSFVLSTMIFLGGGLVGPLLRWIAWPPSAGSSQEKMIYDLVFLLWPAQMLAAVEVSAGEIVAHLLAIGGNVLLFAIAGIAVAASAYRIVTILLAYMFLAMVVVLWALWGAGFEFQFLNVGALIIALCFYGLLVFLARVNMTWNRKSPISVRRAQ